VFYLHKKLSDIAYICQRYAEHESSDSLPTWKDINGKIWPKKKNQGKIWPKKKIKGKSQVTCISVGNVALKNIVCLAPLGGMSICSTIFRIWGSKPMSNIRSASSNAKYFIILSETFSFSIISTNRPGVATKMSTPLSKLRSCRVKS
jgi:hypothetical protein